MWSMSINSRAKIIFGGKLRNPYVGHVFGMERPFFCVKKGMYQRCLGFKFGLTEKLGRSKESQGFFVVEIRRGAEPGLQ